MKTIHFVDLKSQYLKIKKEIDEAILNVIDSSAFINGPEVDNLSLELSSYLNVKHVIPCANGTDALQVAMMSLGLKPGDEVITSDFTFIATVETIALLGLIPKLVDVDYETFNILPSEIEKVITDRTKAIIPVHLFGQCADMEAIMKIAKKHNLHIIEDNAQALGSDFIFSDGLRKKSGTIGHIGCTSFFPSKNLGAYGDGGALFTNDDALAEKIRIIVNHGSKTRYYHDIIGVNSRLDSIQAALLRVKLKHLDEFNEARVRAADFYDNAFRHHPRIIIPQRSINSTHIFHQYTLKLKNANRAGLQEYLKSKGIPMMIYYPVPLHLQKAFLRSGYEAIQLPVTEELCRSVASLPMHSELQTDQLTYISEQVIEYLNK